MEKIRVAVVGVGNCASALIQGIGHYRDLDKNEVDGAKEFGGLIHRKIGSYGPGDIDVVAGFDIDRRKVGRTVGEAIFASPNCTPVFYDSVNGHSGKVHMSPVMDGYPHHMDGYPMEKVFLPSPQEPEDVKKILEETAAEILINFLPVGSQKATEFYAGICLELGIGMANCIPVFIASEPEWGRKFRERNIPIIGDDVKSQLGATILHRTLAKLFADRGITTERTYQLNTGGNTDFLNMLNRERLSSKKISKTESVRSVMKEDLDDENIHVGPSDYIPWQKDNKVCFIRMEGSGFGGAPIEVELRLSVIDSPNSAGVVIDVIRCLKLALDAHMGGPLIEPSSYFMKHPSLQYPDEDARVGLENFIDNATRLSKHGKEFVEAVSKSSPR